MKITRGKGGILNYRYTAGGCMKFHFHLLCEVGAPYQAAARHLIAANKWKVETRELPAAPWCADFVISEGGTS